MKKAIEVIVEKLFSVFDLLMPNKKFIVFASRGAKSYADNSKYLYEYFLNVDDSNIYFFTKNKEVLKSIPKNGAYAYSLKGFYVMLRSRILVFTHGIGDFYPYFPSKSVDRKYINLFHAIAVKKVGLRHGDNKNKANGYVKWDYFLVSSEFEAEFIKDQYYLNDDQLLIFGQPRNDILVRNKFMQDRDDSNSQKILYAPTFRSDSIVKLFPFENLNIHQLDDFLSNKSINIIVKLHINDAQHFKKTNSFQECRNIRIADSDEYNSINEHLHEFDKLISDYSSIVMDYLLLDRPVGYIIYDYEEYLYSRGFSFDFHENRAGPVLKSQADLINFLTMKPNDDEYLIKRSRLLDVFHKYQDGRSSERMYNFIKSI